jgi:hypothetical protein
MTSTSTPIGYDMSKQVIGLLLNAMDEGAKQTARLFWDIFISILTQHWLGFTMVIFLTFIAVTFKAMLGSWGALGSFLYNLFYFGTLFIIGLIWGPEVFVNDIFNFSCAVMLYPICYFLTGIILDHSGLRSL